MGIEANNDTILGMSKLNYICENCGKGVQYANTVSHAKNRVHTIRKPNLHTARVLVKGEVVKRRLCTKCLRAAERPHKKALAQTA